MSFTNNFVVEDVRCVRRRAEFQNRLGEYVKWSRDKREKGFVPGSAEKCCLKRKGRERNEPLLPHAMLNLTKFSPGPTYPRVNAVGKQAGTAVATTTAPCHLPNHRNPITGTCEGPKEHNSRNIYVRFSCYFSRVVCAPTVRWTRKNARHHRLGLVAPTASSPRGQTCSCRT